MSVLWLLNVIVLSPVLIAWLASWSQPRTGPRHTGNYKPEPSSGPLLLVLLLWKLTGWQMSIGQHVRRWYAASRSFVAKLTALLPLSFALLLAACANSPPAPRLEVIEAPTVEVPPTLLTCPDEPETPEPDLATQRDVAIYLFDLSEAGETCRRNLRAVRGLIEAQ